MTEREFIERYTFDASSDLLGEGGFGRVYRAYDNYEHEYVALKMQDVNPQYPELRLRNEYEKVQRFTHPYIARYKACYTLNSFKGETDVAVMKYYEAGSLDKLMTKGALSFEQRCSMLEHILEGIDFLHNNGIIHRDLKPQNILIVEHDGKYAPLITDFGISKQLDKGQSSAVSNSILGGTRNYASPEQLKESKIKKNTDLWSFGIIAYEMFAEALPFNCGTFSPTSEEGRSEYLRQVKSGILPDALNGVPEPWQTLIRACLVVDNEKRVGHVKDCFDIINGGCNGVDDSGDTLCDDEVVVTSDDTIVSEPEEQPNVVVVEQGSVDVKEKGGKKRKRFLPWLVIALVVTIFAFAIPIVKRVIEDKPVVLELIQDGSNEPIQDVSMTVVEGGDKLYELSEYDNEEVENDGILDKSNEVSSQVDKIDDTRLGVPIPVAQPQKAQVQVETDVLDIVSNNDKMRTDIVFNDTGDFDLDIVTDETAKTEPEEEIFVTVEEMPTFQGGGLPEFRNWVQKNVDYPQIALENGIQGNVVVQFVVDTNGRLINFRILQSPDKTLSDATIAVLEEANKLGKKGWKPGKKGGKTVKVSFTLPVSFFIYK